MDIKEIIDRKTMDGKEKKNICRVKVKEKKIDRIGIKEDIDRVSTKKREIYREGT